MGRSASERAEAWVARVLEGRAEVPVVEVDLQRRVRPVGELEALEEHPVSALGGAGSERIADAEADGQRARHLIGEARDLEPVGAAAPAGPDIQRASEWALRARVGAAETLELVARLRASSGMPLVVMTYANPALRGGAEAFALAARVAGVDGVLISDLPPDEAPEVWEHCDRAGLDTVIMVAPTTDAARLLHLLSRCRGFVYCVARTGVTGDSAGFAGSLPDRIAELRKHSALPIAVGFGISTPEGARGLRGVADAVVVGAAFARAVAQDPESGAVGRVRVLAESLIAAL